MQELGVFEHFQQVVVGLFTVNWIDSLGRVDIGLKNSQVLSPLQDLLNTVEAVIPQLPDHIW